MAIQGQKISEMTALDAIKGTEYIPVVDGNTNKKMVISKLAKKEDIPNVSGFITSSQADAKYQPKGNYATTTELSKKADKTATENVAEATKELQPNKYYIFGEVATLTITLAAGEENVLAEYMFEFTSGTTPTTLSLPEGIKWIGESTIEASKTYQVSIVNNIAVMGGAV